jgi:hypothetical protein
MRPERKLHPCRFEFEELELIQYPGILAYGVTNIEVDRNNNWYIDGIYIGDNFDFYITKNDPMAIWIRQALESKYSEQILQACLNQGD